VPRTGWLQGSACTLYGQGRLLAPFDLGRAESHGDCTSFSAVHPRGSANGETCCAVGSRDRYLADLRFYGLAQMSAFDPNGHSFFGNRKVVKPQSHAGLSEFGRRRLNTSTGQFDYGVRLAGCSRNMPPHRVCVTLDLAGRPTDL